MRVGKWVLVSILAVVAAGAQEEPKSLSWPDSKGNLIRLDQYKGKVVVLNFWATWCLPCRHEMPALGEMERKYSEQGLVALGASVDDQKTQAKIQPFEESNHLPFPLLVGATAHQMLSLGLGEAIPATAFFDARGNLVARVLGELDKSELEHRIEWMLGKHHGKEPSAFVNGFQNKPHENRQPSIFTHESSPSGVPLLPPV